MWYVYMILCEDKSLYTGVTCNLERRFLQHKTGRGGKYTRSHRPVKVIYQELVMNRSIAQKREYEIKQLSVEAKWKLVQPD